MRPLSIALIVLSLGAVGYRLQRRRRLIASDPKLAELEFATRVQIAELLNEARERGLDDVQIASARRSCQRQNDLYAQGRTLAGPIITGARGCQSWHVWGRAADLEASGATRETWEKLGIWWEARGGVWGGRFTNVDDPGHFEWHPGLRIADVCPDPDACEEVVIT